MPSNDSYCFCFRQQRIGNMHRIWLYIFLVTVERNICVRSEVFTSIAHIIQLLDTEIELAKQLKIYLKNEHVRLVHIEKFLSVINNDLSQARGKEEQYFSNPINVYLFFKHLTTEWYHIKDMPSPGTFTQPIFISRLI
ncbi:unnamed protein product [Rotaria magnacalcarata]